MRRLLRGAGAALALTGTLLVLSGGAGGQTLPPLVTDYGNYPDTPQALLTEGCDFSGLTLVTFTLNGGPPVGSLSLLPPPTSGDVITMSWQAVSEECVGAAVSLVVKDAPQPFFDPAVNQPTAGYNVGTLTDQDGGGTLSLTLPDLAASGNGCAYQIDAIVGVPLAVVGPSGSFYSAGNRGDEKRTTLISFRNGAYPQCVETTTSTTEPSTTTSSTVPDSTTTSTVPGSTTTSTTAPTTSTTSPSTTTSTTEPPTSTTAPPPSSTAPSTTSPSTTTTRAVPAAAQRSFASTGTTPWNAVAGVAAVGLGVALLTVSWLRRRSHA